MEILELELPTSALERQRDFYVGALGLELLDDGHDRFAVGAGATRLSFARVADDPGPLHFAFNVPENRLPDGRRWIAERAPLILGPRGEVELDFSAWNAHATYFLDAAGNVAELIARHSLPNADDAPFGPSALVEVSEAGVPVSDVPAAVEFLEHDIGLPVWDGDRRGFTALGDDSGLFIVVPAGRPWFPTDRIGRTPPVALTVRGRHGVRHERTPLGLTLEVASGG